MKPVTLFSALAATISFSLPAFAEDAKQTEVAFDIEEGQALYKKNCRSCHGPTAKGLASYPKLQDKSADYLIDRLERYRKGEKFGPNTPLMAPRAKTLSDEDIIHISHFIDSLG